MVGGSAYLRLHLVDLLLPCGPGPVGRHLSLHTCLRLLWGLDFPGHCSVLLPYFVVAAAGLMSHGWRFGFDSMLIILVGVVLQSALVVLLLFARD